MASVLKISDLHVNVDVQEILKGIDLTVKPGEIHALMGPNGSGKSTLANALVGHPFYEVTKGSVKLDNQEMLEKAPDERSNAGLFLAFQYPVEIPGVKVAHFLRLAHQARFEDEPKKQFKSVVDFRKHLEKLAEELHVNNQLLTRGLNEGFSGGEKKRVEILQMATLEPKFAILDETDSGLDVDAIKAVANGIKKVIKKYNTGIVLITHYQRILDYLKPDFVHIMIKGKIVESGGFELAQRVDVKGFSKT